MKKISFASGIMRWAGVAVTALAMVAQQARATGPILDQPDFGTNRPPVQVFYVPMPEDDVLKVLKAISNVPTDPMQTYISIAVFVNNTVLYYDHWENGFDRDIANPNNLYSGSNPGGTQIWGDGDPSNGAPPGYPGDILHAGDVIILNNAINSTTRKSVIDWDGGDKIGATKPVAVTRAVWASGSNTLLAGANEVYDTVFFGTAFDVPVGVDSPDSKEMFEYTGLMIMASEDNTLVKFDNNRDGVYETNSVINEGQTYFVHGGVKKGARILADKPVQVELMTGDIGSNYESRFFRVLPTAMWTDALTTPVGTPATVNSETSGTKVWLYNPNNSAITVRAITRASANALTLTTNTVTVAANGNKDVVVAEGVGMRFVSTGGARFYAVSTTDATGEASKNQAWDWGCTLVPDDALTPQVLVGLGIGRDPTSNINPKENGSPAWVTPIGNGNRKVRVYVDYDSDPTTGSAQGVDAHGNKYDASYDLRELQGQRIYNPSGDQTGILIYTLEPGVKLAAMWGEDPKTATTGSPGLDFGTGIPPLPSFFMQKTSKLQSDSDGDGYITPNDVIRYDVMIENVGRQPVTDIYLQDTLPAAVEYVPNSSVFIDATNNVTAIADNASPPKFPFTTPRLFLDALPVGGAWHIIYDTQVGPFSATSGVADIQNRAVVNSGSTIYTNRVVDALRGRIGDYVWLDLNMDGIQDAGETGLNGVHVRLFKAGGTLAYNDFDEPYEFVTRDDGNGNDGFYMFTGVRRGDYYVEFELPSGYTFTTPLAGLDANYDSDAGTGNATNTTEQFRLDGGQFKLDIDAGLIKLGSISGAVLIDQNGNGAVDPEDTSPIFGIAVDLLDEHGNFIATTTTAPDGSYRFEGLLPGDYTVREHDGNGWTSTTDTDGANDNLIDVSLSFGQDAGGHNFYDTMPVTIGDRVWVDANRNGIQNNGEAGLAGVTVQLLDTNGNVVATATTDASGNYLFANKLPGTYRVRFVPPSGYVFSAKGAGNDDARDSDAAADGRTDPVTLTYGVTNLKIDAGLYQMTAGIELVKTAGNAADGDTLTINGAADVIYTYRVRNSGETWLADITVTDDKLGVIGAIAGPLAPNAVTSLYATAYGVAAGVTNIGTATGNPSDESGTDLPGFGDVTDNDDAVVVVIPYSSVGDFVWVDSNGNGIQDNGEPGLPGVTVTLYRNGTPIASTVSAANGAYLFTNLLEGSYVVEFSKPYGYDFTVPNAGGNSAKDSDPSALTGKTAAFQLAGGANRTDIDAGLVRLVAAVEIIKTAGDAADNTTLTIQGLHDVTYTYLIRNTGATYLVDLAVTDDKLGAIGTIAGPLAPGATATLTKTAYNVNADVTNIGAVTGTPSNPGGDPLDGFDKVTDEDNAVVVVTPYSFIGDRVWNDLNRNGIQDAGEPGIAGVTVTLYSNNVQVAQTTSDGAGSYGFSNLLAGNYILVFTAPAAYQATTRDAGNDDALDSDIDASGNVAQFSLGAGVVDRSRDAGYYLPQAAVELVKTAGNAADGQTLTVTGVVDVIYTYQVKNIGETYLVNLVVSDDKLGAIGTIAGPLAPNAVTSLYATAHNVAADVVNVGTVVATPADSGGNGLPELENVSDSDDAEVVVVLHGAIGDFAWVDSNGNGVQDAGEPGLAGVTVTLYQNDVAVATTTTDGNGFYSFTGLVPGNYQVGFLPPAGYKPTAPDVGSDAGDSDIVLHNGDYRTAEFALQAGVSDTTRDGGFVLLTAGVSIVKTAGNAADGDVLSLRGTNDVIYTYVVKNTGETWLIGLEVTDNKLGAIGTIAGPLAPGASTTLYSTAYGVYADVTNVGTVTGTPSDKDGHEITVIDDVTDSDDAVVVVTPLTPPADPTICELFDFGKEFNVIIFGNLNVSGGDTEGNLLVWGNASLPEGYSVGYAVYGAPMPVASALDDALIVGGDLYIGPQAVNGNVVYGGNYSGFDRRYQPYSVRHVTPVTIDANGNVPEDGSGRTRAEMLAQVNALAAAIAAFAEQGVVSKGFDGNGNLILVGDHPALNVFDVDAADWSGNSFDRVLDVPADSKVILNIRGASVSIAGGRIVLPAGMTPNQVLIHYVDAASLTVAGFDHEGAILAPLASASFSGGGVQGVAILGGDVETDTGAEFHNFDLRVFDCPASPAVRLVVTAGDAPDGYVLWLGGPADVTVRHLVVNSGSSWLRAITLTAADGSVVSIPDLPPGGVAGYTIVITNVDEAVVFNGAVTATPTRSDGSLIDGYASVSATDIAAVDFAAQNGGGGGGGDDDPEPWNKADLEVTDIWFVSEPTITGEVFAVSVKVANSGDRTSTAGTIKLYLVDLNHPLDRAEIGDVPVATVALGTFIKDEQKVFTFKNITAQQVPDHYRLIALVDPDNEVVEYSDGNNHGTLQYSLKAVFVSISVGPGGVTLSWNNYWGQTYTIMGSADLVEWEPVDGFTDILSQRNVDGSPSNSVVVPFMPEYHFFKLRINE